MEINQITLQELGIKIANLEIQNAQLMAQLKVLQEELNSEQPKVAE